MIILLNGPLGIGKTTFAEALTEGIQQCAMLDGDHLIAVNPSPRDEQALLHSTIALLIAHYQSFGYRYFVVNHIWASVEQIDDLRYRLTELDADIRCFLLTLELEENLSRIKRRASTRAIDELEHDLRLVRKERSIFAKQCNMDLGQPFDVSDSPSVLVQAMLKHLELLPHERTTDHDN